MIIKQFKGHSGCKVFLHEKNNNKFVRKISSSPSYNKRLERQMYKQENFKSSYIRTPKILNSGEEKDLFFFDMEYIGGVTFSNYISSTTIQNSNLIMEKLLRLIEQNNDGNDDFTNAIYDKIQDITDKISFSGEPYKSYCLDFDWANISTGFCHGDLTFENILIYKSQIYLIDFLDSFMNTKYIDISKLLQDVMLMWSWRNCEKFPLIKNIYMYDKIMLSLDDNEKEIVQRLLVLNLLRIFPYADEQSCMVVKNSLNFLKEKFKI
tara:strand:+ start:625 stop:1419 length:795 start_codon:yes stop_codon:yes gene_type:complete